MRRYVDTLIDLLIDSIVHWTMSSQALQVNSRTTITVYIV